MIMIAIPTIINACISKIHFSPNTCPFDIMLRIADQINFEFTKPKYNSQITKDNQHPHRSKCKLCSQILLSNKLATLHQSSKIAPRGRNPQPALTKKQVSQCIHKISKCHWILENEHRNSIIDRIHAHFYVSGCAKYEQDMWNIVGCRVVMSLGWTDGQADGRTVRWHDNTLLPKWDEGKDV